MVVTRAAKMCAEDYYHHRQRHWQCAEVCRHKERECRRTQQTERERGTTHSGRVSSPVFCTSVTLSRALASPRPAYSTRGRYIARARTMLGSAQTDGQTRWRVGSLLGLGENADASTRSVRWASLAPLARHIQMFNNIDVSREREEVVMVMLVVEDGRQDEDEEELEQQETRVGDSDSGRRDIEHNFAR